MNDDKSESTSEIAEGLPPAPRADDDYVGQAADNIRVNEPSAREVFFAWERLRVLYNVIVIPFILMSMGARYNEFLAAVVVCNLFFCSGVVAEGYHCWMGINRKVARWGIFAVSALIPVWFFSGLRGG